jgi:hypothetical protein
MSAEIVIPREKNFRLPEGRYRAKVTGVQVMPTKGARDGSKTAVVHFEPQIPGMERYECCARGVFYWEDGTWTKLKHFLQPLLGKDFFLQHSSQRVDLNTLLRDMDCEIDLVHGKHDEKYPWPMVLVENVYPVEAAKEVEAK